MHQRDTAVSYSLRHFFRQVGIQALGQFRLPLALVNIRQRRAVQYHLRFDPVENFANAAWFRQVSGQYLEGRARQGMGVHDSSHLMLPGIGQGEIQAKQPAGACHQDARHSRVPCLYPSSIGRMISRICGMLSHSVLVLLA